MMSFHIIKVIIPALLLAMPVASSESIIFDSSTGFLGLDDYGRCGFSQLRDALAYEGFNAQESISLHLDCLEISDQEIQRADLLIIVNPNRYFGWDEKERITNAISEGKRVLLVCDNPEVIWNANSLAGFFGVRFEEGSARGDSLFNVNNTTVKFVSPLSISSKHIDSEDMISIKDENNTVFSGFGHKSGKVGFLADVNVLSNEYIDENGPDFALELFKWFFSEKKADLGDYPDKFAFAQKNTDVRYSPGRFSFNVNGTEGWNVFASLSIENLGDVNQTFEISLSPFLDGVTISESRFILEPEEKKIVGLSIKTNDVWHMSGYIIVKREFPLGQEVNYLSIEVKRI